MTVLFGPFSGKLLKLLGSPRSAGVEKNLIKTNDYTGIPVARCSNLRDFTLHCGTKSGAIRTKPVQVGLGWLLVTRKSVNKNPGSAATETEINVIKKATSFHPLINIEQGTFATLRMWVLPHDEVQS
ncbi:MAG: hypothetical protein N4A70_02700 [Pelagimonas sp.]|jgi:hypothetical protein|nr:hypothetical protein [Pelagimonas sp.]